MTSKLDEELKRLSKAATQEDDDVRYYGGPTSTHRPARDAYHAALVNAYRTGQLVPAQPSVDLTERQSETLHKALLASYDSMVPPMPSGDEVEAVEAVARAVAEYQIGVGLPADDAWEDAHGIAIAAITALDAVRGKPARKFSLGDRVTKTKGSSWTGLVVGFYSTSLTPVGYAVESENEPGSVQIYPESALASDPLLDRQGDGKEGV